MLEKIRYYFNCSIGILAGYLQISKYTAKSLSTQRRSYSLPILNKLIVLYKALHVSTEVPQLPYAQNFTQSEHQSSHTQLEQLLKKAQRKWHVKQATLQQLQTKRKTWLRGFNACSYLISKQTLLPHETAWILHRKEQLQYLLLHTATYAEEVQLQSEITGLEAQIQELQKVLKNEG